MIGRVLLVVGSVLFGLPFLEIGCRAVRGTSALLHWKNIVLEQRRAMAANNIGARFVYDPLLGHTPTPGFVAGDTHYDADGFRHIPPLPGGAGEGPPILATGDSYTLGDEVTDAETWPAVLQRLTGRRTLNAGVAAYGFDQTVLRTELLAPKLKPAVIVVGFIADDLRRAELSRAWGTEKPYFSLTDGALELRNVPVPPSPRPEDTLDFWHRAFGWSVLLDTILIHQGLQYEWVVDHERAVPAGTGERVACALMPRLARLGVPTLVVAQYDFYVWQNAEFGAEQRRASGVVLKCAEAAGLIPIDLYDRTASAVRGEGRNSIYRTWHPSPEGYRLIAREIAAALERRHIVPGYMPPR